MDSSLFDIRYLTCSSIKGNHKVPIITNPADLFLSSVEREGEISLYCCRWREKKNINWVQEKYLWVWIGLGVFYVYLEYIGNSTLKAWALPCNQWLLILLFDKCIIKDFVKTFKNPFLIRTPLVICCRFSSYEWIFKKMLACLIVYLNFASSDDVWLVNN